MATNSNGLEAGTRRLVLLSVFALGIGAVVTQLALLREMLSVFDGNEMVLGILLGNWLLLTGAGSWLGRSSRQARKPLRLLVPSQMLVAVLPLLQVVALRSLRNIVFTRGAMINASETVLASLLVLAPFCLVSGYVLTLACSILTRRAEDDDRVAQMLPGKKPYHDEALEIGRVYVADSLGSILGGVLFSFGLVLVLDHFGALCVPAALNLALAAVMAWRWEARGLGVVALVLLAGLALTWRMDELTTQLHHGAVPVLFRGNSPYGRLVVTESTRQFNFIENGVPLFSTHNTEQVEKTVHYAMAQRPNARRVLLVGGGASGTAREILKYDSVEQVTYLELDPLIVTAVRQFAPESLADARIRIVNTDGRLFVRQTDERFDVAIVDMPEPSTMQLNRFYTAEFYAELKRILRGDGVVSFALGRYENFVNPDLARLLGSAQRTLRQSFRHTLLLPGGRVFVLASNGELTTDVAARIAARGVSVRLMTRHYLDAMLTPDRLAALRQAPDKKAAPNEDFSPALYFYHLRYWLSREPRGTGLLIGALLTAALACPFMLRGGGIVVFAGGFAATALEVILLLGFQILCGSVYHQVGIVVTVFMAGLAVGGWLANRPKKLSRRTALCVLAAAIGLFASLLPVTLVQLSALSFDAARAVVPALTFGLAMLVGMEFPVATQLARSEPTATAATVYAADFVGAALGALLASTLLIPLLGVAATCWLTGVLNLAAAGLILLRMKRR
jgi:spermidine synthase